MAKVKTIQLTGQDIINLLAKSNKRIAKQVKNAQKIDVTFDVPTGGDYSGITLDIEENHPIFVEIKY